MRTLSAISLFAFLCSLPALAEPQFAPEETIFHPKVIGDFALNPGEILLTIDDGPSPYTLPLLKVLQEHRVRATFFLVGQQVQKFPDIAHEIAVARQCVGNHTMHHIPDPKNHEELVREVLDAHVTLLPFIFASGTQRFYFRPPGGHWDVDRYQILSAHPVLKDYIGPIGWNFGGALTKGPRGDFVTGADWACWKDGVDSKTCAEAYYKEILARGKGVILMHDVNEHAAEFLHFLFRALERGGRDGLGGGKWKFRDLDQPPELPSI